MATKEKPSLRAQSIERPDLRTESINLRLVEMEDLVDQMVTASKDQGNAILKQAQTMADLAMALQHLTSMLSLQSPSRYDK